MKKIINNYNNALNSALEACYDEKVKAYLLLCKKQDPILLIQEIMLKFSALVLNHKGKVRIRRCLEACQDYIKNIPHYQEGLDENALIEFSVYFYQFIYKNLNEVLDLEKYVVPSEFYNVRHFLYLLEDKKVPLIKF